MASRLIASVTIRFAFWNPEKIKKREEQDQETGTPIRELEVSALACQE